MNEFMEKSANIAKEAAAAAKELTFYLLKKADQHQRLLRLQFSKTALKKLLTVQYREMGILVYEMCKRNISSAEEITRMTVQIDATKRRIAVTDRRIQEVMELIRCPRCGSVVKIKNAFCSHCGYKLAAEEEQMVENENEMVYQEDGEQ
ncbi:MAG: zinc ribbon domain-containing protein [Firmicutes bacterium]|nr:zinc ribbon domain-containing protein [[Eubacterium] siraeum]MCM1488242.1 zinc ribbon domain-containing protein [Bacillota bacterium]